MGSTETSNNDERIDRIDQCKVFWYQWKYGLPTATSSVYPISPPDTFLAASTRFDISNHIENLTFNKNMGEAAGSFSITLHNSSDWLRFIKAGQWVCIYLSGDGELTLPYEDPAGQQNTNLLDTYASSISPGKMFNLPLMTAPALPKGIGTDNTELLKTIQTKYLRCIGLIQRVAAKSITNADGTVETSYVVSGKDFGAVYEDTELWFNMHVNPEGVFVAKLKSRIQSQGRNLDNLLNIVHDVFLNQPKFFDSGFTPDMGFIPKQWLLPDVLISDLNLGHGVNYFGDIKALRNFRPTVFEQPSVSFLDGLSGNCWDRLRAIAQPEFHELFTELENGMPTLTYRMIPWALDTTNYSVLESTLYKYADLAAEEAPSLANSLPRVPAALDIFDTIRPAQDTRTKHNLAITATMVDSFDVGPDQHHRSNLFLVDTMRSAFNQKDAVGIINETKSPLGYKFPLRNENDIKRHGLKVLLMELQSYNLSNPSPDSSRNKEKTAIPDRDFILAVNNLAMDFYANANDMYSGTINLTAASNEVALGKVILTDYSFNGISNMVFYIEGYTDTFNVNQDGTTSWTQSIKVSRGISKDALDDIAEIKSGIPAQSSTFQPFNKK